MRSWCSWWCRTSIISQERLTLYRWRRSVSPIYWWIGIIWPASWSTIWYWRWQALSSTQTTTTGTERWMTNWVVSQVSRTRHISRRVGNHLIGKRVGRLSCKWRCWCKWRQWVEEFCFWWRVKPANYLRFHDQPGSTDRLRYGFFVESKLLRSGAISGGTQLLSIVV